MSKGLVRLFVMITGTKTLILYDLGFVMNLKSMTKPINITICGVVLNSFGEIN